VQILFFSSPSSQVEIVKIQRVCLNSQVANKGKFYLFQVLPARLLIQLLTLLPNAYTTLCQHKCTQHNAISRKRNTECRVRGGGGWGASLASPPFINESIVISIFFENTLKYCKSRIYRYGEPSLLLVFFTVWPHKLSFLANLLNSPKQAKNPSYALINYTIPPLISPAPPTALLPYLNSSLLLPLNALTNYPIPPLIAPAVLLMASAAFLIACCSS
jgi:hypothetical protein